MLERISRRRVVSDGDTTADYMPLHEDLSRSEYDPFQVCFMSRDRVGWCILEYACSKSAPHGFGADGWGMQF